LEQERLRQEEEEKRRKEEEERKRQEEEERKKREEEERKKEEEKRKLREEFERLKREEELMRKQEEERKRQEEEAERRRQEEEEERLRREALASQEQEIADEPEEEVIFEDDFETSSITSFDSVTSTNSEMEERARRAHDVRAQKDKQHEVDMEKVRKEGEDRLRAALKRQQLQQEEKKKKMEEKNSKAEQKLATYKAQQNDQVDQMLASYLKKQDTTTREQEIILPESIIRLGSGMYMFGNMKVHLRCVNGYLVARVGGGWMPLTQFLNKHSKTTGINYKLQNTNYAPAATKNTDEWKYLNIEKRVGYAETDSETESEATDTSQFSTSSGNLKVPSIKRTTSSTQLKTSSTNLTVKPAEAPIPKKSASFTPAQLEQAQAAVEPVRKISTEKPFDIAASAAEFAKSSPNLKTRPTLAKTDS